MTRRGAALTVSALTAAALIAPIPAVSLPAAAAPPLPKISRATGDVQIVATEGYRLVHSIRHANGAWDGYGTLYTWEVPPGTVSTRPTSATVNGEEHVMYEGSSGHHPPIVGLFHDVRHSDGYWNGSGVPSGNYLRQPRALATTLGQLHMITSDGTALLHSAQLADGSWTAWESVPVAGNFTAFAAAGDLGDLRTVLISPDGKSLVYTVRHSDGTWSPAQQVAFTTDRGPGPATAKQVSVAQVGDDLQLMVLADRGDVYHSILHPNGRWDLFRYVGSVAGEVGAVTALAAAASQGALQAVVVTADGGLYHTMRFANGSWQRYGDVRPEIGESGQIFDVTLAGD